MPLSIVATIGSASANSFVTEAEFIAHCASRLNPHSGVTVSGGSNTETEKAALIEAGRWLNLLAWLGSRTDEVQAMAWPRQYVTDPDAPALTAVTDIEQLYFADDELPTRVKLGQMELAIEFLKAGTTDIATLDPNIGVIEKTIDVLTTRYAEPYQRAQGLNRFPRVVQQIAPLLAGSAGGLEVVRT